MKRLGNMSGLIYFQKEPKYPVIWDCLMFSFWQTQSLEFWEDWVMTELHLNFLKMFYFVLEDSQLKVFW